MYKLKNSKYVELLFDYEKLLDDYEDLLDKYLKFFGMDLESFKKMVEDNETENA